MNGYYIITTLFKIRVVKTTKKSTYLVGYILLNAKCLQKLEINICVGRAFDVRAAICLKLNILNEICAAQQ